MKIFISQPMAGLSREEVLKTRERQLKDLFGHLDEQGIEIEIIDSWIEDQPPPEGLNKEGVDLWYLAKSIDLMTTAEMVVFMPGWHKARGCRVEELVASQYGLDCQYL